GSRRAGELLPSCNNCPVPSSAIVRPRFGFLSRNLKRSQMEIPTQTYKMKTQYCLKKILGSFAFATILTALTPDAARAALPFTPGNLVAFSADSASANNTTFTILELNSSTANQSSPVNSVSINGTSGGNALRCSGSGTSTGYMADSDDGTLVAFTG